jgi:hypothetical protein
MVLNSTADIECTEVQTRSTITIKPRKKRRNSLVSVSAKLIRQAKSKSAPVCPTFSTDDDIEIRETLKDRSKTRTKRTRSRSFTHVKQCEKETPVQMCTPRTILTLPLVESCIQYLTDAKVYKIKGIFRECGNYTNTQAALTTLRNSSVEKHTEIYQQLAHNDVADLLKALISFLGKPLIDDRTFKLLSVLPHLRIVNPQVKEFELAHLQRLYINSVLTSSHKEAFALLAATFSFLRKVIKHKAENCMGLSNVATVFAPLILPAPSATNISNFMKESQSCISLMEDLLHHFLVEPELFLPRFSVGKLKTFSAINKEDILGECIIPGDTLTIFHRDLDYCCVVFQTKILVVSPTQFDSLYQKPSRKEQTCKAPHRLSLTLSSLPFTN